MAKLSSEKAKKRDAVLTRLKRFAHYTIAQLEDDSHLVRRRDIEKYMLESGIPLNWITWCLSVALHEAHKEGRIEKAGPARGRGAGWRNNEKWRVEA